MAEEKASILSMEEIGNIRQYVRYKHKDLTPGQQAEIIADAIKRVIFRKLPELPLPGKQELADMLIRSVVAAEQRSVNLSDVMAAVLEMPVEEEELKVPLHNWLTKQAGINLPQDSAGLSLDKLRDFLHRSNDPESLWLHLRQTFEEEVAVSAEAAGVDESLSQLQVEPNRQASWKGKSAAASSLVLFLILGISSGILYYSWKSSRTDLPKEMGTAVENVKTLGSTGYPAITSYYKGNELPAGLRYTLVNEDRLKLYLKKRSSMLAESPYFEAIIDTAQTFDIHPLLLFAITGQEQGFVPRTNKRALQIANNPFNVFHSWQDFNTDIYDSSAIAARTIVRLSRDKPDDMEPIRWLNRQYAEDPNWHKGVASIFASMQAFVQQ
ncbi:Rho GTPase-activating protein [Paenibacillus tarimensis]|uniref:hypothetical protein n=1 Tax=Paenibacillus tarimensis TaxID=416012 RepID=UPI001F469EC4|nr:hypothetical protein [Paenibacillus tarimensis]MCF2942708.1 hypothetical protein [Paenibacillus tarimensis]